MVHQYAGAFLPCFDGRHNAMLVVFLALFIVMRGVTLVFAGWNADRVLV